MKGLQMKDCRLAIRRFLVVSLILSAIPLSAMNVAGNVLDNPSFENYAENSLVPDGWETMKLHSLDEHHRVDTTVARTGQVSAMITNRNPALDIKSYLLFIQRNRQDQLRKYAPGTEMEFSVYAMTASPDTRFRIYYETRQAERFGDSFASPIQGVPVGTWKKVSLKFKMPVSFTSFYVCLQLTSIGTVWFDDAYLGPAVIAPETAATETNSKENRILNPSLEQLDPQTGTPLGWNTHPIESKEKFHFLDNTTARTGNNSLKISSEVPLSASDFVMWQQFHLQNRLKDCPPGTPMVLSFWANNNSNPSVKFRYYVEMRSKGKFIGTFISPTQTSYFGWKQFFLEFEMPQEVPDSAYLCLQLLTSGAVWFDDIWLGKSSDAPEKPATFNEENEAFCRVADFPPQQTWFYPEQPDKLSLEWLIPQNAAGKLQVTLTSLDGGTIQEYILESKTVNGKAEIQLPKLDKGVYLLNYEAGFLKEDDIFRIIEKPSRGVQFTADRRMFFNSNPFFPLIVVTPEMTEEALRIYGEAGFNTVTISTLTENRTAGKYLGETAAKYGLAVVSWSNFPDSRKNDQEFSKMIAENIKTARELQNFMGWLSDESEMRDVPLSGMKRTYRELFANAPEYLLWENHAPRMTDRENVSGSMPNIRRFTRQSDVTGCDIYPVPEGGGHSNLENRTISCVGEYTDLSLQAGFGQKPVWMILQAGAWGEWGLGGAVKRERPTYEQYRFMFYNAVTHGATAVVMFGQGVRDIHSPFMAMMADVNHEFKAIEKFFTLGNDLKPQATGDLDEVRIVQRSQGDDILIVAVNEGKMTRKVDIVVPAGKTFHLLPSGEIFQQENGSFSFSLQANEVLILSTIQSVIPKHGIFKAALQRKKETDIERDSGAMQDIDWAAQWTAHPEFYRSPDTTTFAAHKVELPFVPERAFIRLAADDEYRVSINGTCIGNGRNHSIVQQYNIAKYLKKGANAINFEVYNIAGPSGLIFEGNASGGGQSFFFSSGEQTLFSKDKEVWVAPRLGGKPPVAPWGNLTILVVHKDSDAE